MKVMSDDDDDDDNKRIIAIGIVGNWRICICGLAPWCPGALDLAPWRWHCRLIRSFYVMSMAFACMVNDCDCDVCVCVCVCV